MIHDFNRVFFITRLELYEMAETTDCVKRKRKERLCHRQCIEGKLQTENNMDDVATIAVLAYQHLPSRGNLTTQRRKREKGEEQRI